MTDEKKTGETSETPYPGTLSWAATRLLEAICDAAKAVEFFMAFAKCDAPHVAIENPVGCMSTRWRKPDQIVQPYMFGDPFEKKTCLWLKGLEPLKPTDEVEPEPRKVFKSGNSMPAWYADAWHLPPHERAKVRSRTFPGIAKAMANQWCEQIGMEGV